MSNLEPKMSNENSLSDLKQYRFVSQRNAGPKIEEIENLRGKIFTI